MGPPIGLLGGAGPSDIKPRLLSLRKRMRSTRWCLRAKTGRFSMYHPARSILQDAGCTRAALKERERARKPTTLLAIYLRTNTESPLVFSKRPFVVDEASAVRPACSGRRCEQR